MIQYLGCAESKRYLILLWLWKCVPDILDIDKIEWVKFSNKEQNSIRLRWIIWAKLLSKSSSLFCATFLSKRKVLSRFLQSSSFVHFLHWLRNCFSLKKAAAQSVTQFSPKCANFKFWKNFSTEKRFIFTFFRISSCTWIVKHSKIWNCVAKPWRILSIKPFGTTKDVKRFSQTNSNKSKPNLYIQSLIGA